MREVVRCVLCPVLVAVLSANVWSIDEQLKAPQESASNTDSETLTGDWGGLRTDWRDKGVTVDFGYKADAIRNVSGGLRRGGQTMWQLDARVSADFEKLWGWDGTSAYLQVLNNRGGRINERYTGSLMGISNIEVPTAATHVFHAWIQHAVLDDRLLMLVGLYPVDSEFATIDSAGLLLNPTFGASSDFSPTRGPSIFPISSFGTRFRWHSSSRSIYVQGALLDGVPGDPDTRKGTHIQFNEGDGTFSVAEIGHKPGDSATDEKAKSLAAPFDKLALGAWSYSARDPDLVDGTNRKSFGYYLLAEKTLYRPVPDAPQGVAGFFRYSATGGNSTPIRDAINLGLRYQGLIPGRGEDVAVLGLARIRLSDKYREVATPKAGQEDLLEATYQVRMNKWFTVQPLIQFIRNSVLVPSGGTATAAGIRIEIAL